MNNIIKNQIIHDIYANIGTIIIMLGGNNFPPWIYDDFQNNKTVEDIIMYYENILDVAEGSKYVYT